MCLSISDETLLSLNNNEILSAILRRLCIVMRNFLVSSSMLIFALHNGAAHNDVSKQHTAPQSQQSVDGRPYGNVDLLSLVESVVTTFGERPLEASVACGAITASMANLFSDTATFATPMGIFDRTDEYLASTEEACMALCEDYHGRVSFVSSFDDTLVFTLLGDSAAFAQGQLTSTVLVNGTMLNSQTVALTIILESPKKRQICHLRH